MGFPEGAPENQSAIVSREIQHRENFEPFRPLISNNLQVGQRIFARSVESSPMGLRNQTVQIGIEKLVPRSSEQDPIAQKTDKTKGQNWKRIVQMATMERDKLNSARAAQNHNRSVAFDLSEFLHVELAVGHGLTPTRLHTREFASEFIMAAFQLSRKKNVPVNQPTGILVRLRYQLPREVDSEWAYRFQLNRTPNPAERELTTERTRARTTGQKSWLRSPKIQHFIRSKKAINSREF